MKVKTSKTKVANRGLYLHIPFCQTLCYYCDFCKIIYQTDLANLYLAKLKEELDQTPISDICSIYVGGGTPTSLNITQLEKLLNYLDCYYQEGMSYTFEANVENLTLEKIKLLKKHHVNRISLGIQTFSDSLLKRLNRHHTLSDVNKVILALIENGITDINCDLIYGLPNQDEDDLKNDLKQMIALPITHISTYALSVCPHTFFAYQGVKEQVDQTVRHFYDMIVEELEKAGYNRYEISNFAKSGYQSKHNLLYWRNMEYYGIGLGASGYLDNKRYTNTKSLTAYLKGEFSDYQENLTAKDLKFYYLMLNLRLTVGVCLKEYQDLFKEDLLLEKKTEVASLLKDQLLILDQGSIKVNPEHFFIHDYILRRLLF